MLRSRILRIFARKACVTTLKVLGVRLGEDWVFNNRPIVRCDRVAVRPDFRHAALASGHPMKIPTFALGATSISAGCSWFFCFQRLFVRTLRQLRLRTI